MNKKTILSSIIMVLVSSSVTFGELVFKSGNSEMNIGGRMQLLGQIEYLNDPVADNTRVYLFQNQNRIYISGKIDDYKYRVEWAMGGEENPKGASKTLQSNETVSQPLNSVLSLKDFYFDMKSPVGSKKSNARLRIG